MAFSPIVIFATLVQPSNTGDDSDPISVHFSALNTTEERFEQSLKAESPIVVTELGMDTEVSAEQ